MNNYSTLTGFGIAGCQFQNVLPPIGAMQNQFFAVGRPRNVVNVMADHIVIEGHAVAHIGLRGLLRFQIVDQDVANGVGGTGFRIRFGVDLILNGSLIQLQEIVLDLAFVEAIESQLFAIRRPPECGSLPEFFAIDPTRGTIFQPAFLVAVGTQGDFVFAIGIGQVEISLAIDGFMLSIGGRGTTELSAPIRSPPPPRRPPLGIGGVSAAGSLPSFFSGRNSFSILDSKSNR